MGALAYPSPGGWLHFNSLTNVLDGTPTNDACALPNARGSTRALSDSDQENPEPVESNSDFDELIAFSGSSGETMREDVEDGDGHPLAVPSPSDSCDDGGGILFSLALFRCPTCRRSLTLLALTTPRTTIIEPGRAVLRLCSGCEEGPLCVDCWWEHWTMICKGGGYSPG